MQGRSRIITLELSKVEKAAEKPVGEMTAQEQWAFFFRYLTDKSQRRKINELVEREEGIAMASEVLISISKDEVERARLMSEYKYVVDTQSKVVHAKREGIQQGMLKIARHMKADNVPASQISAYTGLTEQQIKDL